MSSALSSKGVLTWSSGPWLQSQLCYPPNTTLRNGLVDKTVFSGAEAL